MINGLDKGKPVIHIKCVKCKKQYESMYNKGQVIKYLKEFGQYENMPTKPCPTCGTVTFINVNIPAEELEETFFDKVEMDEEDRQQRRILKDLFTEFVFEENI